MQLRALQRLCFRKSLQNFAQIWSKFRFANLEKYLYLAGPTSATPPSRAPLSTQTYRAQRKMKRAGSIARLYSRITRPFFIQNSPKLLEIFCCVIVLLQIMFLVLPKNYLFQNYQRSRWDVDLAAFNLCQSSCPLGMQVSCTSKKS